MKSFVAVAVLMAGLPVVQAAAANGENGLAAYERSVVGLNVTFQRWDEDQPWVKLKPEVRRVSAVMVAPGRFLTTADALESATYIQLTTAGRARQAQPRVDRVDKTVNLALVSVDDQGSLNGLAPVAVAERTPIAGTLRTAKWRGQQLEVAASRVIRIEVERSSGSLVNHAVLRMRTDLAGGGWSEPVFDGDSLVGVTISQTGDESRAVAAEIIGVFLRDASAGIPVQGVATLGANWQLNRDSAVTEFLGQQGEPKGILIRAVPWGTSGCGVLKPRDIVLELGGEPIDPEGYYKHPWLGRIGFNEILAERFRPGDPIPVRVWRAGHELELTLTARTYPAALNLVSNSSNGAPPYLIAGGFVIRELDTPYLRTWGKEWDKDAPQRLLSRAAFEAESQTTERRRIVLITGVMPASYNLGYQELKDVVIDEVNGRAIGKIEDVAEALKFPLGPFQVLKLSPDSPRDEIVLDAATLEAATAEILAAYGNPPAFRAREEKLPPGGGDCRGDY